MNPKLSAFIGLICGIGVGYTWAIMSMSNTWKVIPIESGRGYSNVYYPAYLFNSYNGTLKVVGRVAYDDDRDGKADRWENYYRQIHEPQRGNDDPYAGKARPLDVTKEPTWEDTDPIKSHLGFEQDKAEN